MTNFQQVLCRRWTLHRYYEICYNATGVTTANIIDVLVSIKKVNTEKSIKFIRYDGRKCLTSWKILFL